MRALLAWELGSNLGHVSKLIDLADALTAKGWEVSLALRNPTALAKFGREGTFPVFQAPCKQFLESVGATGSSGSNHLPNSYIEDLIPCGYDDPQLLQRLMESWLTLFETIKPDILIGESAPTATLSARCAKIKRINLGSCYDTPPLSDPLPPLRYWLKEESADNSTASQQTVLQTVNQVLGTMGFDPLDSVVDILEVDRSFLCGFEEFDHYPTQARQNHPQKYYGQFQSEASGEKIYWRDDVQFRILAYIVGGTPSFQNCLNALRSTPDSFDIIYISPSFSDEVCESLQKSNMRVFNHPLPLGPLIEDCDLLISNGNSGISSTMSLNGVPALMFPSHIEQNMFARAMGRHNLGQMLVGEFSIEDLMKRIRFILHDESIRESCRKLADKYKWFDAKALPELIAREISEEFLETGDSL